MTYYDFLGYVASTAVVVLFVAMIIGFIVMMIGDHR